MKHDVPILLRLYQVRRSIYYYRVSVLNLNGVETDSADVATGTVRHLYLPLVEK